MLKKQLHFIPCRLENLSFLGLCLHDISPLNKRIGEAGTSCTQVTRIHWIWQTFFFWHTLMPQYTIAKGVFFMAYDLVMHMDACDISLLELTLNNITNYLAGLEGTPCSVSLVANAAAVKLFTKDCPKADRVNELAAKGVAFKLCANALRAQQLQKEDMLAACIIVPAGVVELVRLQDAGHAYVKP